MLHGDTEYIRVESKLLERVLKKYRGWDVGEVENVVKYFLYDSLLRASLDRELEGKCSQCDHFTPPDGRCLELGRCHVTGQWINPEMVTCDHYEGCKLTHYEVNLSVNGKLQFQLFARTPEAAKQIAKEFISMYADCDTEIEVGEVFNITNFEMVKND